MIIAYRVNKIARSGYGFNKGAWFHDWVTKTLVSFGIHKLSDLKNIFDPQAVRVDFTKPGLAPTKVDGTAVTNPEKPMLAIITSDITTGNKIQFPAMWDLYWDHISEINPADFVRASMSIPVFYETYKIKVRNRENKLKIWQDHLNWKEKTVPEEVQLVDGGALSNFPINIFYNPDYIIPRMPTIGIRLGSGKDRGVNLLKSIGSYIGALISTIKSSTDKEFITKNKAFELGVMDVDLNGHSWLNFFLETPEKEKLFYLGAKTAAEFLKNFKWEDYKKQRKDNYIQMQRQRNNPNNWNIP